MRLRTPMLVGLMLVGALAGYAGAPLILPDRGRDPGHLGTWVVTCALVGGGLGLTALLLVGRSRRRPVAGGPPEGVGARKRGRWRRLGPRLLLAAGSVLLTLGLGEVGLRLCIDDAMLNRQAWSTVSFHVNQGRELIPNTQSGNVLVNALGYRDREFPRAKLPGVTRIVAVGDSITFGGGVDGPLAFPKRLEARLHQAGHDDVEVINGGVPDTGLAETLRLFERRDLAIGPDVVLVCFYLNDSRPPMGFRSEFVGGDPIVRLVNAYPEVRRSRLASLAYVYYYHWSIDREVRNLPLSRRLTWTAAFRRGAWRTDPAALDALIREARYDWGAAWLPESWPGVEALFDRFDAACRAHGVRPVLVAMPSVVQIEATAPRREPQERLGRIAGRLGWPYHDLVPDLAAARGAGALFLDHCHLTQLGHEQVARSLAAFLERSGLLGPAR